MLETTSISSETRLVRESSMVSAFYFLLHTCQGFLMCNIHVPEVAVGSKQCSRARRQQVIRRRPSLVVLVGGC